MLKQLTIPIGLTLTRLILAPFILPFLLVYALPYDIFIVNVLIGILFLLFSLTDFFDGYLARRYKQVTRLGALLDPIADKFLVLSVLISLLAIQRIYFVWVLLFIGRELFVTSLRAIAAEQGFSIPVIFRAKAKTTFQIFYITLLIVKPLYLSYADYAWVYWFEYVLLSGTIFLSLESAYSYYKQFMKQLFF